MYKGMTLNFHKSPSPSMNMNDRSQIIKFFHKSLMAWIAFYSEVESTFLLSYIVFLLIYFLKKPRSECQRIATVQTWVDTKSNLGLTSAPSKGHTHTSMIPLYAMETKTCSSSLCARTLFRCRLYMTIYCNSAFL